MHGGGGRYVENDLLNDLYLFWCLSSATFGEAVALSTSFFLFSGAFASSFCFIIFLKRCVRGIFIVLRGFFFNAL